MVGGNKMEQMRMELKRVGSGDGLRLELATIPQEDMPVSVAAAAPEADYFPPPEPPLLLWKLPKRRTILYVQVEISRQVSMPCWVNYQLFKKLICWE